MINSSLLALVAGEVAAVRAADGAGQGLDKMAARGGGLMEGSFEHFVLTRGEALLRFAVMLSGDLGRAEDLVQTTLLRDYPQWDRVADMERPEGYLRTILVRTHLRWWRRRASREVPAGAGDHETPDRTDLAQRHADRDEAWELLARLPRRQRAVLVLRYYEDLPDSAIARTLGCGESTVRSQAARGLASLRAALSTVEDSHGRA